MPAPRLTPEQAHLVTLIKGYGRTKLFKPPPCQYGAWHVYNISMGAKEHDDIGREGFYCVGKSGNKCQYQGLQTVKFSNRTIRALHREMAEFKAERKAVRKSQTDLVIEALEPAKSSLPKEPFWVNPYDASFFDEESGEYREPIITAPASPPVVIPGLPVHTRTFTLSGRSSPMKFASSDSPAHSQSSSNTWDRLPSSMGDISDTAADGRVAVHVFLEGGDEALVHSAVTTDGLWAFYEDRTLCNLTGHPKVAYEIYDLFHDTFVPIPTYSKQVVGPMELLVIRKAGIIDGECPGLEDLIPLDNAATVKNSRKGKERQHNIQQPVYPKRRRMSDEDASETPRHKLRRRIVID
ncbi:hypothetical protein NMY22_g9461 [Coprinellus aureogranulatus]|nr:hypothetical protein NMY22_g9461 [Coprinellus aureogranulatus]